MRHICCFCGCSIAGSAPRNYFIVAITLNTRRSNLKSSSWAGAKFDWILIVNLICSFQWASPLSVEECTRDSPSNLCPSFSAISILSSSFHFNKHNNKTKWNEYWPVCSNLVYVERCGKNFQSISIFGVVTNLHCTKFSASIIIIFLIIYFISIKKEGDRRKETICL